MSDELLVYTCITGGYDELHPVVSPEPRVRYVCLTDRPIADARGWEVRLLDAGPQNTVLANRYAKMHPHLLFPQPSLSIYVDGTIQLKEGMRALAEEALRHHDFAAYSHPFRDCIYEEAAECAAIGHDWVWSFARQLRRYRAEGLSAHAGLFECNILFRRHHAPDLVALMDLWWREFRTGVHRDQLSLPYLAWKTGFVVNALGPSHIRTHNPQFGIRMTHNAKTWRRDLRGRLNRLLLPRLWVSGRTDPASDARRASWPF